MERSGLLFLTLFMANAFRGRFLALFYEAHDLDDAQIGYILSISSLVRTPRNVVQAMSAILDQERVLAHFFASDVDTEDLTGPFSSVCSMLVDLEGHCWEWINVSRLTCLLAQVSLACSPLASKFADKYDCRALVTMVTFACAIGVFLLQLVAWPKFHVGLSGNGRFAVLFVLRIFQAGFASPVYALMCAMCIAALRNEFGPEGHTKFGQKRLWGAVGWAFSSLLLGVLLDQDGIDIWIMHVGYSVLGSVFLVVLFASSSEERVRRASKRSAWDLYVPTSGEYDDESAGEPAISATAVAKDINQQTQEVSYSAVLNCLFSFQPPQELSVSNGMQSRARILVFLIMQFMLAAVMSTVENLLFLFFKDDLNASYTVCGLSVVITVVFEIPLFACAPSLLEKAGTVNLLMIATMSFAVRAVGYTLSPNGYWVLLWEPLHGVTYACADTAAVAFVAERMPKELEASGQALLGALRSTGMFAGTVVGGWVLETYGPQVLYRGAAILIAATTCAFYFSEMVEEALSRTAGVVCASKSGRRSVVEMASTRNVMYSPVQTQEDDPEDLDLDDIVEEALQS